ncbi:hypothetical protein H2200_007765 [Cladophialophora chaetospira]|uniref:RNA 3'-terminal phosphate cyclase domain-containing protein n=1 Tax=Cladophialophora chaetospira TaxID=386627 RepID=A0AA38X6D2_9EURO|nr:hypothetical protein H2200_007765 [Cladophialophora chaetospira]
MITLDGSTLEGGGQLVRVALSLSAICNIPVHITNIRAGRGPQSFYRESRKGSSSRRGREDSKGASSGSRATKKSSAGGGLKESHLAALNWLAEECNAKVEGAEVGSLDVVLKPRPRRSGRRSIARSLNDEPDTIELRNPGSVWLIWQAIFPYIVFRLLNNDTTTAESEQPPLRIRLRGGTNVPKSPSSEYMQQVFLPLCEKIGLPRVNVEVIRRGWTTGAAEIGEVEISVFPPETSGKDEANSTTNTTLEQKHAVAETVDERANINDTTFHLQPFTLSPPSPFTITSISITTICGSSRTQTLLQASLHTSLRLIPTFSHPTLPITTHESSTPSSGDERRLYILLTAHLSSGHTLGRDYLAPHRKIGDEADRRRFVDEAVNTVVRDFRREVEREKCVDEFVEDQLVVFQALAEGGSQVDGGRVGGKGEDKETGSLHTRTGGGLRRRKDGLQELTNGIEDLDVNEVDE